VPLPAPGPLWRLLRLETWIREIRSRAIIFGFEFYPETGHELLAEGSPHVVPIDTAWRARDLPESIKRALSQ
jgi:acyl-CoA thioesterase FadM